MLRIDSQVPSSYHSVDPDKVIGTFRPGRQDDIVNFGSITGGSQIVRVVVYKQLRKVEKLRN